MSLNDDKLELILQIVIQLANNSGLGVKKKVKQLCDEFGFWEDSNNMVEY